MPTDLQLEQETTIAFNEGEDNAEIWSASPVFQRRMKKLGVEPYKTTDRERGQQSCCYSVPRKWIRVKPPLQRQLTEEQKQAMADRARRTFTKKPLPQTGQVIEPSA